MDQMEVLTQRGSAPYYAHQGTSFKGLQGSPSMNSLSTPIGYFLIEGKSLIGSGLPLATSSRMSPHVISEAHIRLCCKVNQSIQSEEGLGKMDDNTAVSLPLLPSTSSPVPIVRSTQEWRGRSPGTGQQQQLVSRDGWRLLQGPALVRPALVPHVLSVAAGEDIRRKILSFAQRHRDTVILSCNGTISAVNVATRGSRGIITLEGHFSMLSLAGHYRQNHDYPHGVDGNMNVIVATPNGRIIGGRVEDFMIAMDLVQVIVGTF